jgi:L-fuconate dehydratase
VTRISRLQVSDVRFPTSRELDGSDAMNPDPDHSAAYVQLDGDDGSRGDGFVFTIGRGNEVVVAALRAVEPLLIGRAVGTPGDLADTACAPLRDSRLRRLGPERPSAPSSTRCGTACPAPRRSRCGATSPTCRPRSSSTRSTSAT